VAAVSNTGGTADESIQFTANVSGTWYADVLSFGGSYDTANTYLISGEVIDPEPPETCEPDDLALGLPSTLTIA
jgi:hypothetical protein